MMRRETSKLVLVGMALLLTIQLTGLSCFNDWGLASLVAPHSIQITNNGNTGVALGEDACPCHLAFVSVPSCGPEVSYPVSHAEPRVSKICPVPSPSLPFHPPLGL